LPEPVTPSSTCSPRAVVDALNQLGYRLGLVAGGLEFGMDERKRRLESTGGGVSARAGTDMGYKIGIALPGF
jgi:tetrahydromethanopterin S-methyltransferase subunit G